MKVALVSAPPTVAPPTEWRAQVEYDEFVKIWYPRVQNMVWRSRHFTPEQVAEVTQELFLSMLEKDYLNLYDPTRDHVCAFSTFVYGYISRLILSKRDKARRMRYREGVSLNTSKNDSDSDNKTRSARHKDAMLAVQDTYSFELDDTLKSVYRALHSDGTERGDVLASLLYNIVQQLKHGISAECRAALGEEAANQAGNWGVNRYALAWELGVRPNVITTRLKHLREHPACVDLLLI